MYKQLKVVYEVVETCSFCIWNTQVILWEGYPSSSDRAVGVHLTGKVGKHTWETGGYGSEVMHERCSFCLFFVDLEEL